MGGGVNFDAAAQGGANSRLIDRQEEAKVLFDQLARIANAAGGSLVTVDVANPSDPKLNLKTLTRAQLDAFEKAGVNVDALLRLSNLDRNDGDDVLSYRDFIQYNRYPTVNTERLNSNLRSIFMQRETTAYALQQYAAAYAAATAAGYAVDGPAPPNPSADIQPPSGFVDKLDAYKTAKTKFDAAVVVLNPDHIQQYNLEQAKKDLKVAQSTLGAILRRLAATAATAATPDNQARFAALNGRTLETLSTVFGPGRIQQGGTEAEPYFELAAPVTQNLAEAVKDELVRHGIDDVAVVETTSNGITRYNIHIPAFSFVDVSTAGAPVADDGALARVGGIDALWLNGILDGTTLLAQPVQRPAASEDQVKSFLEEANKHLNYRGQAYYVSGNPLVLKGDAATGTIGFKIDIPLSEARRKALLLEEAGFKGLVVVDKGDGQGNLAIPTAVAAETNYSVSIVGGFTQSQFEALSLEQRAGYAKAVYLALKAGDIVQSQADMFITQLITTYSIPPERKEKLARDAKAFARQLTAYVRQERIDLTAPASGEGKALKKQEKHANHVAEMAVSYLGLPKASITNIVLPGSVGYYDSQKREINISIVSLAQQRAAVAETFLTGYHEAQHYYYDQSRSHDGHTALVRELGDMASLVFAFDGNFDSNEAKSHLSLEHKDVQYAEDALLQELVALNPNLGSVIKPTN